MIPEDSPDANKLPIMPRSQFSGVWRRLDSETPNMFAYQPGQFIVAGRDSAAPYVIGAFWDSERFEDLESCPLEGVTHWAFMPRYPVTKGNV